MTFGCSTTATGAKEAPAAPVEPTGFIGHQGRWLTDAQGRVLLMHGINIVVKNAPFDPLSHFNAADASTLAADGILSVRLGVQFQALMPQPGRIDQTYLDQIRAMVHLLGRFHIYALLDMHQDEYGPAVGFDGFPKWATLTGGAASPQLPFPDGYNKSPAVQAAFASFWADRAGPGGVGLQERYVAALVALARTFRNVDTVLGYDVMNEPWPGPGYTSCESAGGCPSLEKELLVPFYTKAAKAILAADPHHLVFVEPFLTFDYEGATSLGSFGAPNNALSFHPYIPTNPAQGQKAIALSAGNGDALLATEFGATTDPSAIATDTSALDQLRIPWMIWDYPTIFSAGSSSKTVAAVTYPSPLAVAGLPLSYGFDRSSRVFTLDYRTTSPKGERFGHSAVTAISIPKDTYPSGYRTLVSGGSVTSTRCADLLTVTGASASVKIIVAPAASC